jgi:phage terminase small subunit
MMLPHAAPPTRNQQSSLLVVFTTLEFTQNYVIRQWMGRHKELTEMQKKFAYELVTNEGRKTKTECAIEAGYDKNRAVVTASELTNPRKYPMVVQYIGELREEFQKKYEVTFERHITELARLRDESKKKGAWSAAINAEVARGKAAGLYVEQKIIRTGKLEDLTAEELEIRMKQIMHDYSPILEGVEVKEIEEKVKNYSSSSSSSSSKSSSST